MATMTHGITLSAWIALSAPILTILGAIGRALNKKLLSVQGRLDNQDKARYEFEQLVTNQHNDLRERVARLEGPVRETAQAVKQ